MLALAKRVATASKSRIKKLLPVRVYLKRRYDRAFERDRNVNYYRGVFDTFEAARLSAPETKRGNPKAS